MNASDVIAVAAAIVMAGLGGALVATLVSQLRVLRCLQAILVELQEETAILLADLGDTATRTGIELDRMTRVVDSAQRLEEVVGTTGRLAYRTLANPVVKAMAVGSGVSRARRSWREKSGERTGSRTPRFRKP